MAKICRQKDDREIAGENVRERYWIFNQLLTIPECLGVGDMFGLLGDKAV